jgi:hypothetical protein
MFNEVHKKSPIDSGYSNILSLPISERIEFTQILSDDIKFEVDNSAGFECVEISYVVSKRNNSHLERVVF